MHRARAPADRRSGGGGLRRKSCRGRARRTRLLPADRASPPAATRQSAQLLRHVCRDAITLFSIHLRPPLPPLRRLVRQRRGGPREQPRDADRLPRFLAPAVAAVVDPRERLVDLLHELALAVAGAELERVLLLDRRAVGGVGNGVVLAQVLGGHVRVREQLLLHAAQPVAEERELGRVHVLGLRHLDELLLGEEVRLAVRRGGLLHWVLTRHCSNPWMKTSLGRFRPMNTIALARGSSSPQRRPRSPPMSMCTPWKTTRCGLSLRLSTPLYRSMSLP